ncbi:hypothetical protein FQA39_LY13847 [Lamprigera yunnana]|nr:hypothetical protein FQA39_LY13847 [Lamprigera yunnana]
MFNITKPKLIFCSKKVLSKIQDIKNKVSYIEKIIVLDGEDDTEYAETFNNFISCRSDVVLDPDNCKTVNYDRNEHIELILLSSSTTGLPKGVTLTDTNILTKSTHSKHRLFGTDLHIKDGGSVVNFLPLFHTFGLFTILNYVTFGIHVVQIQVFKEELLLRSIEFPLEKRLMEKWLINCGNINLIDLTPVQLYEKRVCASHFSCKHFTNSLKNRLIQGAVPLHYNTKENADKQLNISSETLNLKREAVPKVYKQSRVAEDPIPSAASPLSEINDDSASELNKSPTLLQAINYIIQYVRMPIPFWLRMLAVLNLIFIVGIRKSF